MEKDRIAYEVSETTLGWLLVAGTGRGVCNVRIGDDPAELERGLREEFPWAEVAPEPGGLAPWADALRRYLSGDTRDLRLPLDVRGSRFQRRVWDAIASIPCGRTRTYSEIAADLGTPRGARAVARACAANPVAVVVPCHRVVPLTGEPGGYRWGAERKRALLALEGAPPRGGPAPRARRAGREPAGLRSANA